MSSTWWTTLEPWLVWVFWCFALFNGGYLVSNNRKNKLQFELRKMDTMYTAMRMKYSRVYTYALRCRTNAVEARTDMLRMQGPVEPPHNPGTPQSGQPTNGRRLAFQRRES